MFLPFLGKIMNHIRHILKKNKGIQIRPKIVEKYELAINKFLKVKEKAIKSLLNLEK